MKEKSSLESSSGDTVTPNERIDEIINAYIETEENISDTELKNKDFEMGLEMATLCSPGCLGKVKCRIYILENPVDHGNIGDGKRYIPDRQNPAHVHVYDANNKLVGLLNITGPRPQNEEGVWEYRKPIKSKLDKYREDIVNWANTQEIFEEEGVRIYNWSLLRLQWKNDHPKNPFRNGVRRKKGESSL